MDIKSVIKEKGFTLEELANILKKRGIMPKASKSSLSQSINGNPTLLTMRAIADVIGCEVVDFFKDEETKFSAIIDSNGILKKVTTIEDLKELIKDIEK